MNTMPAPSVHVPSGWGHFREWKSPGGTIDRFIASLHLSDADLRDTAKRTRKKIRAIVGPIGSGKTTGVLGACQANAQRQPRVIVDREQVRVYSLTVMRTDYRLLWGSFIDAFWFKWFPQESAFTHWSGAIDQKADQIIRLNTPFGKVMWKVAFRALSDLRTPEQISNFWRGQLPNDIWLEEGDGFSLDIYQNAYSRLGRGVEMRFGGPTSPTMFISTNRPLIGHWMDVKIETGAWKRDEEVFIQPAGDSPGADNLVNLPPTYYEDQKKELDERNYRRLVQNERVMPRAGMPVHPEYRDSFHGSDRRLLPQPGLPLVLGIDPRTHPSGALLQYEPRRGQWQGLDEVCGEKGMGAQRFAEMVNALLGTPQYEWWSERRGMIRAVADPSATYGADDAAGELDWLQRVAAILQIDIVPARSNKASNRRDPIKALLRRTIGNAQPAIIFSNTMMRTRAGLGGMFHYAEINLQGAGSGKGVSAEPVKNEYADICEAVEYAVQEFGGLADAGVPAGHRARSSDPDDYPDYAET